MEGKKKSTIAIVGSGTMGGGMAQVFALAGHTCVISDVEVSSSVRSLKRLVQETESFERQGLFPEGSAKLFLANVSYAESIEDACKEADYIAESVPEIIGVKELVLTEISKYAPKSAVIATNTSAIPMSQLSSWISHPDRFLGVHWVNPAPFVPGVEIIAAPETTEATLQFVERLIGGTGKVATRVSDGAGFIINRLQFALYKEAMSMFEEGSATPAQIDSVVSNTFGFRLAFFGPFAIADMGGLDVFAGAYKSLEKAYGERFAAPQALVEKVAAGDYGFKTGGGFAGLDANRSEEIVAYRNRAFAALSQLKKELGPPPGFPSIEDK
jgi:3-hydroxybutyryl-CoA dehydrogenase